MADLWRISRHVDLTGEGGRRASARWHHAGKPIVYLAESAAGALLEVMVHLEMTPGDLPPSYTLLRVSVEPEVRMVEIVPENEAWRSDVEVTRALGDSWLSAGKSALARVPSGVLPSTWNVLFNPAHSDAARVRIIAHQTALIDSRLLRAKGLF